MKEEKNKKTKDDEKKKESKSKKLPVKKEETAIDKEQLEKIGEEIIDNKKKSKLLAQNEKKYKEIMRNILVGILFTVYFGLLLLGKEKIPTIEYITDLKTFIIFDLIVTLALFETAYKRDSGNIALHGIEMNVVGGLTIWILDLFSIQNKDINVYASIFICVIVFYYLVKSVVIKLKKSK